MYYEPPNREDWVGNLSLEVPAWVFSLVSGVGEEGDSLVCFDFEVGFEEEWVGRIGGNCLTDVRPMLRLRVAVVGVWGWGFFYRVWLL